MKLCMFCVLVMACLSAASQSVTVLKDSSALLFPNNVTVALKPVRGGKQFLLSSSGLHILILQSNYLSDRVKLLSARCELLMRDVIVRDSIIVALKRQAKISQERVEVFSDAYAQSKIVSAEYDAQTRRLVAEVKKFQKDHRSARRKSFFRGAFSGFAGGILLTAVYLLAVD
jgi:hypothetical protein